MEIKYYYQSRSRFGESWNECTKDEYFQLMAQGVLVMTHVFQKEDNGDIRDSFDICVELPLQLPKQ